MDSLTPWLIASLPFAAAFGGWVVKTYIGQVVSERGPKGERGERGERAEGDGGVHSKELLDGLHECQRLIRDIQESQNEDFADISVRKYKYLSEYLIGQFNGRYMLATEAREKFTSVHQRMDVLSTCITDKIDDLRTELSERFQR